MGVRITIFQREGNEHSDIDIFSNFAIMGANSHVENFIMLDHIASIPTLPVAGRS